MLLENPAAVNGCIIRARRLALEEVRRQDEEFARRYGSAGDGELLGYLRERAAVLGHTPAYDEVCGYRYLKERFGSLEEAERLAGLRPAPVPGRAEPAAGGNRRIAAEEERQRELYNRTLAALDRRFEEFYRRNRDCGEEALLAQLRAAADCLGRSPGLLEVIGGEYIRRRFGGWGRALKLAGLTPRTEAKAPWDSDLFREALAQQKQAVLERLRV